MTISTWNRINRVVSAITQASPAVVTTTTNHNYKDGLYVRFYFPEDFGMSLLNGQVFLITVLSSNTFSIPIDTTAMDAFSVPMNSAQSPQVIPVGEISGTLINAERNTLSPQAP